MAKCRIFFQTFVYLLPITKIGVIVMVFCLMIFRYEK